MFSATLRRGLVPVLCLLAGPALSGPAEDCRNLDIEAADSIAPCTAAIKAATDPAERADLLLWRASSYKSVEDYWRAEADIAAALALRPDWADPFVERAYLLKAQGNTEGALAAAQQSLETEPTSVLAHKTVMSMLADAGRWQDCLDLAPRALELGPDDPETLANRGRCLTDGGDDEAAVADYRRAIGLGLEEFYVHSNLALSLLNLGRPAEALPEAQVAVSLDASNIFAQLNLIRALAETDDVAGAIEAYRTAAPAAEAMDRTNLANTLAWGLYENGHMSEALPFAEEATSAMRESGEPNPDLLDTYAHLLAANGRPQDAANAFLEVVETDPARQANYVKNLGKLGFLSDPSDLTASFLACAKTGAACRLWE